MADAETRNGGRKSAASAATTVAIIDAPRRLLDRVRYHKAGPGSVDHVANAERLVAMLDVEFPAWRDLDRRRMVDAWDQLKQRPQDAAAYLEFSRAVHVVKGNAALLKRPVAGEVAARLAQLLERALAFVPHERTVEVAVRLIGALLSDQVATDDIRVAAAMSGLDRLMNRRRDGFRPR